ncbi:VOC family protein [Geotalea sp. SG265]|uniref:VOC family protein n=1 Tax=Geotalea sp. SG265 TaxID=2922867 RepID=UPI001FB00431|nr:VOC family protein [Geotalea sp. SG265]
MPDKVRVSIQLVVSDLGVTEAFYGGILQMPIERALTSPGAPEHLVMVQDGWKVIFVEESAVLHAHAILEDRLTAFPKGVGMTIHIRVDEIEEIYDALLDEELEILYPLELKPYRVFELWCFDPDGYLVVLEQPLETITG